MKNKYMHISFFILMAGSIFLLTGNSSGKNPEKWPQRVLITNDNGIEDVKIIELAKAFSGIAETYVVAPLKNQSSSTNYTGALKKGYLEVKRIKIADNIKAYAVDGYPADCVVLALAGIMKDNPPDLVISGINGGPNLGREWLGSGTIGAARVAGFAGFPAIAISGLDSDIPGAIEAAVDWVIRFAQSPVVRNLKPPQYLTVSIPRIPAKDIKGIQITNRSDLLEVPVIKKVVDESGNELKEIWKIAGMEKLSENKTDNSDITLYEKGYIVIVPMQTSEIDHLLLESLHQQMDKFPKWNSN